MIAKDFDLGKDCCADNKEWQGKVCMEFGNETILPSDVVLVHIDLKEKVQLTADQRGRNW